ncbi:MAG: type I restriction enzyme HsdR N-terminal domain-containing protein [Candidatus Omnitrophica bacterium]|nr:type I restriction enzyme HsdR N-terminal domain-containing protein [Candidatus Omnitrophota bacterium]
MVRIPKKVSERLKKEMSRFQKILKKAKDRDVNESDTVTIITDMLAEVFGYDKYSEITSEQAIRGTYCDLAIKLDGKMKFLIEVKAIGLNLKDNHLRQVIGYGATNGIPWVVLTNGIEWQIYRIKFEKPVNYELVFTLNFAEISTRKQEDQDKAFLLCKEGLEKAAIEEFHDHVQSVNRFMIGAILQSDTVISVIRRELRKMTDGVRVKDDEIRRILIEEVLKRDTVQGEMVKDAMSKIKKAHKKKVKKASRRKKIVASEEPQPDIEQG